MGEVMKLSAAQRSAMLALDCANGVPMPPSVLRVQNRTLRSLYFMGMCHKDFRGGRDQDYVYYISDKGRAWCKTNFTDVLNVMINEAEK